MADARAVCGCGRLSRTVTGSGPPWLLDCARPGSARPMCSRARSTASAFAPISSRCWRPHWHRATSSCLTIVLLDHLRRHKVAGIAEAIAARGAQLIYLPPDSPDLNPIEQAFAKYKALLRKAAERTVESLWQAIARIADLFPPAECRNLFNSAGYVT